MSKKCRFRKFLKNSKKILNSLETWKIEAVLENQYRKWGFHQNPAKVDFEESGKAEKNDELGDQKKIAKKKKMGIFFWDFILIPGVRGAIFKIFPDFFFLDGWPGSRTGTGPGSRTGTDLKLPRGGSGSDRRARSSRPG